MSFKNEIEKVDKNFLVDQEIDKTGLAFYSPEKPPFRLYGVKREGDRFYRIPPSVAESVSEGVLTLAKHTSGGRVRFMTDSENIAIKARLINAGAGSNQSCGGSHTTDYGNTFEELKMFHGVSLPLILANVQVKRQAKSCACRKKVFFYTMPARLLAPY